MATSNIIEGRYAADWLKREEDSLYSREQVTIVSGAGALVSGTVLGKITASGKYKTSLLASSDGSQTPAGILLFDVDATSADRKAVIIARDAIVAQQALIYGADIDTAPERATANATLAGLGILVREGA